MRPFFIYVEAELTSAAECDSARRGFVVCVLITTGRTSTYNINVLTNLYSHILNPT